MRQTSAFFRTCAKAKNTSPIRSLKRSPRVLGFFFSTSHVNIMGSDTVKTNPPHRDVFNFQHTQTKRHVCNSQINNGLTDNFNPPGSKIPLKFKLAAQHYDNLRVVLNFQLYQAYQTEEPYQNRTQILILLSVEHILNKGSPIEKCSVAVKDYCTAIKFQYVDVKPVAHEKRYPLKSMF